MIELNKKIQAQFDKMCATGKLFRSSLLGQEGKLRDMSVEELEKLLK